MKAIPIDEALKLDTDEPVNITFGADGKGMIRPNLYRAMLDDIGREVEREFAKVSVLTDYIA